MAITSRECKILTCDPPAEGLSTYYGSLTQAYFVDSITNKAHDKGFPPSDQFGNAGDLFWTWGLEHRIWISTGTKWWLMGTNILYP